MLNPANDIGDNKLFDGRYRLLRALSHAGGTADVWLAEDTSTIDDFDDSENANGIQVAIKIYRPKNIIDLDGEYQFKNEFKKVFNCHHANILQPSYFSICDGKPYLVLPYCPAGSAEQFIGKMTDPEQLWKFIFEVASGLAYLHEHSPQIIHQDIKPANVLIDDNGNFVITDFGISVEMGGIAFDAENQSYGTISYMAPERFYECPKPMPESDIWAFGATLYELITGHTPYYETGGNAQKSIVPTPEIHAEVPDDIKQLIYSCLDYNPKNRPTARKIIDQVMKRHYSKTSKKAVAIGAVLAIVVAAVITYFALQPREPKDVMFLTLYQRGDSIMNSQYAILRANNAVPLPETSTELEAAIAAYQDALAQTTENATLLDSAQIKIDRLQSLISEVAAYNQAADWAMKAENLDIEEELIKQNMNKEFTRNKINQLLTN